MADRVILHSDINCCYASIEHLHHPELAGKPLAVGGDPEARHGIVLTADYIAKKYGVKTGMALWQAKQVCPDITFVSPRMDLYLRFSRMAHEIYAEYTDRQEPYGIDECWLDVTGSSSLKGDGLLIAQEISRRMKSELQYYLSSGVYGTFERMVTNRMEKQKKADGKKNLSKLSYYRHRVFPGMELYENYPLLVKHKWLIPAYWCYRIVRLLFSKKRRDYILCEVKAVEKVAVHNNNTEAK